MMRAEFIDILYLILISTTIGSHTSRRLGTPIVVGQLLVDVLPGQTGLGWVKPDISAHDFSEVGVILLMFLIDLESNLSLLKKRFRSGMFVVLLGIILPVVFDWLTGEVFQVSGNKAIFSGVTLTATSVGISVEILKELNVVNTKEDSTILSVPAVDDILVVLVLSFSLSFLVGGAPSNASLPPVLVKQLIYFVFIFLLVKWITPFSLSFTEKVYANSSIIIIPLVTCLDMSYVAGLVGPSFVIDVFFAGIAVSQTEVREEVYHNAEVLGYAVLIPVSFVSVGLEVDFSDPGEQLPFISVLTLVAILAKLLGRYLGAQIADFFQHSSLTADAGMTSRGEVALIILQIGQQSQLIEP